MDLREKQKISTNKQYLCDHIKVSEIVPLLIQEKILNFDDEQRIQFEITEGNKVHKLLGILEEHQNGFKELCYALKECGMVFIADALEDTPIDEKAVEREKNWSDKLMEEVLKKNFCVGFDGEVYLGNIVEDLKYEFRHNGQSYFLSDDYVIRRVEDIFQNVRCFKHKKHKTWVFQHLRRKCSSVELSTDIESNEKETSTREVLTQETDEKEIIFEKLSPEELVNILSSKIEEYDIPSESLQHIIEGEITGKNFKYLKMKYMGDIFPHFSKGKKLSILNLRDDLVQEYEQKVSPEEIEQCDLEASEKFSIDDVDTEFRETFRKFGRESKATDCYRGGAILQTGNTRPSNLLEPVHTFSSISSNSLCNAYSDIADEVVNFAAACLNERSNGTIHFGIIAKKSEYYLEGEVRGLKLNRDTCLRNINRRLHKRFYSDQIAIILKCIRPPQFIEVTTKDSEKQNLYIVEVDIVPESSLVKEEAFFVKDKQSQPVLFIFSQCGISPIRMSDVKIRTYMSKTKGLLSDCRQKQEKRPAIQSVQPDLRMKMLDCLSSGEEKIPTNICILLFLGPFEHFDELGVERENFEFLLDFDANAFFDFNYSENNSGLFRFVGSEKNQVLSALTTDNFDPRSHENQRAKDSNGLLEDMKQYNIKPWIFCNGYEPMNKEPMVRKDWKKNRMKGFKEVIRFYSNEIPDDRALVLFFLFSKNYDIMLEAAEEVIVTFKDQWVLFAESEEIAYQWCSELIRRETVDKIESNRRTVLGMPWSHVNQTINQLTGLNRPIRCEIPTSSGAFCHLKEKDKSKLHDLEILSRNECDDPEIVSDSIRLAGIRRKEAETFYRGGAVSWWNFWFPDHVLKRAIHKKLKTKIKEAISGARSDEDNKIGLVTIYHQPGAGGTTTAMHVLWELRTKYRCCIVKQITDQTVEQITDFRTLEEKGDPKPPIILIDNVDEEKVGELFAVLQNKAKIEARRGSTDMKVFCLLLLCIRRTVITSKDDMSVALRHDLQPAELEWFRSKHSVLEKQFKDKKGADPKYLISFNILKQNFNPEYIRRTAQELVKGVENRSERRLLKYLSMLNTFDLECQPLPLSAFDPIMKPHSSDRNIIFGLAMDCGRRKKTDWENYMSHPLEVLLNQNCRAGLGKQLTGLSIINPLFANEIFSCFQLPENTSSIVIEFLESEIFTSSNMSSREVIKVVKDIMRRREEKEHSMKVKFSPLIMKLLQEEDNENAVSVLIKVYEMTKDPSICQHIARLYIHFQNWDLAAKYAEIATEIKPQSSSLWDTYGQVYKNKLLSKYIAISQQGKDLSNAEIEEAIEITKRGIIYFKKEQEVSESEFFSKGNDAGYYGELKMVILLLDIFRFCKLGKEKMDLHRYLTDKDFIPNDKLKLRTESIDFMKSLEENSETTIQTIEEKLTQLKDDLYYSVFGKQVLARNAVTTLRENFDSYFGEESNAVPENLSESDKAAYRRRRVRRIGGRSLLNFLRIDREENLHVVLDMLLNNVRSEHWEIFDIINLINVVIAMKVKKIPQSKLDYSELVTYTRKCYEKAILDPDKRIYLEVFMFFVLFNWPTIDRKKQSLCSVDQLQDATKRWKAAFHKNHPRQRESKPIRKRETTILFLGNGKDMNAIVHYEELHDPQGKKFIKGDRVWETEDFVRKLQRLQGTLIEGTEVSCNIETTNGGISTFAIPTSVHILNRALWQRKVFFVLGFSWAGVKAFDVREEMPIAAVNKDMFNANDTGSQVSQSITVKKSTDRVNTHDQFMATYIRFRKQKENLQLELGKATDRRSKELENKLKEVELELAKLIRAREDFYSN